MGLIDMLRRQPADSSDAGCLHGVLSPRWDDVADMGCDERASSFRCQSCSAEFAPDEVFGVRQEVTSRLRSTRN
jgi:hypothetical protein